jgi:pheromone shutdown protein TraB
MAASAESAPTAGEDDYFSAAREHVEKLEAQRRADEEEEERRRLELARIRVRPTVRYVKSPKAAGAEINGVEEPEREIYLVGTAHVSLESVREVEEVVQLVQPDTVVLELCGSRRSILALPDNVADWQQITLPSLYEVLTQRRSAIQIGTQLLGMALGYVYQAIGKSLQVVPGAEFRAAFRAANVIGSKVILGDREVTLTLGRSWSSLTFFQKFKFLFMLGTALFQDIDMAMIEEAKDPDVLYEMLLTVGRHFPSLLRTLIAERDTYLAATIQKCGGRKVVAVVGFGHLNGIIEQLQQDQLDIQPLVALPEHRQRDNYIFIACLVLLLGTVSSLLVYLCYLLITYLVSLLLHVLYQ